MIATYKSEREAEEMLWALRDATKKEMQLFRDKHGEWCVFEKLGGSWSPLTTKQIAEAMK